MTTEWRQNNDRRGKKLWQRGSRMTTEGAKNNRRRRKNYDT